MNKYATAESLMFVAPRPEKVFVRGSGSWLFDAEGRAWLDFVQGWAVNALGHSSPIVQTALQRQAELLIHSGPGYFNAPACALARRLTELSGLDRVFFANSGAEANEGAIKLARKWGAMHRNGAFEIVVFEDAFHGRTLATMSASGKPQWRDLYEPKVPGFIRVPRADLAAVRSVIGPQTVAVLLEPVQGEAGVIPFPNEYLADMRQLTRELGVLLMFDEIQTGIGRTGRMFCWEHAGVQPDVMTLGKGLGGGVPLTALLAKSEYCCFEAGDQGGTFNGNALMTAVGGAVVREVSSPQFLNRVRETGDYLASCLTQLSPAFDGMEIRGRGLLLALELRQPIAQQLVSSALAAGLLLNAPRPNVLRFMPALTVTRDEIDQMAGIMRGIVPR